MATSLPAQPQAQPHPASPQELADALRIAQEYFGPQLRDVAQRAYRPPPDIVDWAHQRYYIPETGDPIRLAIHQQVLSRMVLDPSPAVNGGAPFVTIIYSTVKKSGKTSWAGMIGRYRTEHSGPKAEVYMVANDKEQAKDRAYESAKTSIELSPGYNRQTRTLYDTRDSTPVWRIIEKQAEHQPTLSFMRAIASDYEGAAGGNPTMTLWTELWALTGERMKRLWDEMTPVPTRVMSQRLVETYAGFEDESEILHGLFMDGMAGRRLTVQDLEPYARGEDPWPYPDHDAIPVWINEAASMLMYWDSGEVARRMPWQQGLKGDAYYRQQATELRPEAFKRFHRNEWVSSNQEFIPLEWWTRQRLPQGIPTVPRERYNEMVGLVEAQRAAGNTGAYVHAYSDDEPIVVGVDASTSNDCTAIVGVSRHPDPLLRATDVVVRFAHIWHPERGRLVPLDDVEYTIRALAGNLEGIPLDDRDRFTGVGALGNLAELTYDAYQLTYMMQRLRKEYICYCKAFNQMQDRERADKGLYDMLAERHVWHTGEIPDYFISNCAAYVGLAGGIKATSSAKPQKIDKLRIVKKSRHMHVDPIVSLSMAAAECLRLLI